MSSPSSPVLSSRTPRLSRYSWARSCCCSASLCLSSVAITVCVSAAFSRPSLSTSNVLKSSRSGGGGLPVSRCVLRVPSVGVVVTRVSFGRPCFVSCDCSSRLRRNIWQALQHPSFVGRRSSSYFSAVPMCPQVRRPCQTLHSLAIACPNHDRDIRVAPPCLDSLGRSSRAAWLREYCVFRLVKLEL